MGILIGEKNWRGRGVAAEVIIKSSTWLHEKYGVRQLYLESILGTYGLLERIRKLVLGRNKHLC